MLVQDILEGLSCLSGKYLELNGLMISNDLGMQLHNRWTRGQMLTDEEQAQLEVWYQQQDAEEAKQLNLAAPTVNLAAPTIEISDLQAQVEMALAQLTTVIQRVQQITTENETLRREISTLRQQLTTLMSA